MFSAFKHYLQSLQPNAEILRDDSLTNDIITFRYKAFTYIFWHDSNNDSTYIRLIIPKIQSVTPDQPRDKIYDLINKKNQEFKVAKAFIADTEVWAVAESFVYSQENINFLFDRLIHILDRYVSEYHNEWLQEHTTTKVSQNDTDSK